MDTCTTTLARTGSGTAALALVGVALLVGGQALVLAARRRIDLLPTRGRGAAPVLLALVVAGVAGVAGAPEPAGAACPPPPPPVVEATTTTTTTTTTTGPVTTVPAGAPPTALDDEAIVPAPGPATVDVLANDDLGDPEGALVETAYGPIGTDLAVPGGTFRLDADGTATLAADDPEVGVSFGTTYTLANSVASAEARVILTVQPLPPTPPAAVDDTFTAVSVTTATGNVLANDDRGQPEADVVAVAGGEVGVTTTLPGGATFRLDADGTATFTTTDPVGAGSYSTTYTIENAGGSSTATVTMIVLVPL